MRNSGRFETRYSLRGYPVQVWVRDVPRLVDETLDCAVYMYSSEAAAEDGEKSGGSGFLVGVPVRVDDAIRHMPCVVTNKHVIENGAMVVRLNTTEGKTDIIALDQAEWIKHPDGDDLAICPIGLSRMHKYDMLPMQMLTDKHILRGFELGIGEETFLVGRFFNAEGRQQNTPTVRFGTIAQMPNEPILQEDGFAQESFLVETKTISGYSGGPVFWFVPPQPNLSHVDAGLREHLYKTSFFLRRARSNLVMGAGPWLLGISYCYIQSKEPVRDEATGKSVPNFYVRSNTGLMGVIPAWKLIDLLNGPQMTKIRKEVEAELRKAKDSSGVVLTSSEASQPSDVNPNAQEDFKRLVGAAAQKQKPSDQTS